jgi:hypothetical protein
MAPIAAPKRDGRATNERKKKPERTPLAHDFDAFAEQAANTTSTSAATTAVTPVVPVFIACTDWEARHSDDIELQNPGSAPPSADPP